MNDFELPEIIELNEFNGNYAEYNEAVYNIFKDDFVFHKPIYRGKKLSLKAHPIVDGKEYTYYHFTHSGKIETERIPDIRRMERIGYPKPCIDNSESEELKVWRNLRGTKERILILHEEERYLIVLEDRKDYILPWTAFYIDYPHQMRKYLKEYETFKKTETAV